MRLVLVETISTFRERYVLEVLDGVEIRHCLDSVTCEEAETFSSEHLGEHIISHREIDEDEMMAIYKADYLQYASWSADKVKEVLVTPWPYPL